MKQQSICLCVLNNTDCTVEDVELFDCLKKVYTGNWNTVEDGIIPVVVYGVSDDNYYRELVWDIATGTVIKVDVVSASVTEGEIDNLSLQVVSRDAAYLNKVSLPVFLERKEGSEQKAVIEVEQTFYIDKLTSVKIKSVPPKKRIYINLIRRS